MTETFIWISIGPSISDPLDLAPIKVVVPGGNFAAFANKGWFTRFAVWHFRRLAGKAFGQ